MINRTVIALLCALLMSCSTMPIDTLNKKLATFEIAYGRVLETVGLLMKTGTLTGDNKTRVQDLIRQVSKARTAVYIAKGYNDIAAAESNLVKARAAFKLITEIVNTLNKQSFNNWGIYHAERITSLAVT